MKSFLEFNESVVPAHMQGKQKPYVSSDGKGNYEVLGNTGKTKATFTRAEHGKDAHVKAQKHLKSKYNEYMNEEEELNEEVSSGNAQHGLSSDSEKKEHADYMKKTHGVSTKYHGKDELSYHGSKSNVKKAVLNHYNDDESEAKDLHPHVFKESVELDEDKMGSWVVHKDGKMLKRFSTHTGAKAHAEKHGAEVASSEFYQDKVQKKTNEEVELDEGFVDDIKQSFAKGMADKVKKAIPAQYHKHYDFDSIKSVNDTKEIVKKAKNAGHMKESVEIDELNVDTLKSYKAKRQSQQDAEKASNPNPERGDKHWISQAIRSSNMSTAQRKINRKENTNEEVELDEEELDELSKATLGAYVKDASADRSSKNFELGYEAGAGRQPTQRAHDQEGNRRKGIRRAVAKLTKEEQEVEEATIAGTSGWEKIKKDVKDKSGAVHTPMSRARDLARQALKNVRAKKQVKGE